MGNSAIGVITSAAQREQPRARRETRVARRMSAKNKIRRGASMGWRARISRDIAAHLRPVARRDGSGPTFEDPLMRFSYVCKALFPIVAALAVGACTSETSAPDESTGESNDELVNAPRDLTHT